eukprot:m.302651 g.302651  ORF g.302651 m.302651 type:complete len:366 (+) comp27291_c0_seq6:428-1525(+)
MRRPTVSAAASRDRAKGCTGWSAPNAKTSSRQRMRSWPTMTTRTRTRSGLPELARSRRGPSHRAKCPCGQSSLSGSLESCGPTLLRRGPNSAEGGGTPILSSSPASRPSSTKSQLPRARKSLKRQWWRGWRTTAPKNARTAARLSPLGCSRICLIRRRCRGTTADSVDCWSATSARVWGLDPEHDVNDPPRANAYDIRVERDTNGPDPAVRQAMLNIVADMGILPETLQQRWGLVPAYPSTDRESPVSHITTVVDHLDSSPPTISVSARAVDTGGGVIAAIEVSLDGGVRFHPMSRHTDRGEWVYTWGASRSDVMYDDPREFKRANGARCHPCCRRLAERRAATRYSCLTSGSRPLIEGRTCTRC